MMNPSGQSLDRSSNGTENSQQRPGIQPVINLIQQSNFYFAGPPKKPVTHKSSTLSSLIPTLYKQHSDNGIYLERSNFVQETYASGERRPIHAPHNNDNNSTRS